MSWDSGAMEPEDKEQLREWKGIGERVTREPEPVVSEPENVRFSAELAGTEDLHPELKALLAGECVKFISGFVNEWLLNIRNLEEAGFVVDVHGQLVCTNRHLKSPGIIGKVSDWENLMELGQAIQQHQNNATHITRDPGPPFGMVEEYRNGSTCGPDCETHGGNHG